MSAGVECGTAVAADTGLNWVNFVECGELLYEERSVLRLNGAVGKSCVGHVVLYESGGWCQWGGQDVNFPYRESNVWNTA